MRLTYEKHASIPRQCIRALAIGVYAYLLVLAAGPICLYATVQSHRHHERG